MSSTRNESTPPKTTRLVGAVVLSFCVVAAICHFASNHLVESIHRLLTRIPGYSGQLLAAGVLPTDAPAVVVIGSSLSTMSSSSDTLVTAIGAELGVHRDRVVSLAYPGRNIADLFSELIRAREMRARVPLVEINIFNVNDRRFRLGGPRQELRVTSEEDRAVLILGEVRRSLQIEIVHQLGVNGLLSQAAERWSPSRFRTVTSRSGTSTSIVAGVVPPIKRYLLGVPASKSLEPTEAERSQEWEISCNNFNTKRPDGLDADVLEDMFKFASESYVGTIFFIAPMNRAELRRRCGQESVDKLDAVIRGIRLRAASSRASLVDLSSAYDDQMFEDYGHCARPWIRECNARLASHLRAAIESRAR